MKRFVLLMAALAALTVALTSANARDARSDQARSICHRTASATRPYVLLRVTARALRAHTNHPADIIPAPRAGCPRTLLATNGGTAFNITLVGNVESPAGDPVATGTSTVRLRAGQGQLCYRITASNLSGPAVAAHIHKAAAGASGPVVIPLATPGSDGKSGGCVAVARTLVAQVLAAPASYYVNVHTAEFPAGAIRGQLTGTSAAMAGTTITLDLKGTSEPNATGTAVLRIRKDDGQVCYRLHAANITLPATAAHIHKGAAGTNGPVVVPFTAPGAKGDSSGCSPADAALITGILANPSGYYVNVHTMEHPAGAIRAQLG
jgi:CHRD domain